LEDYLSLKNCVAVATFFDERYSKDNGEVAELIGKSGFSVKQPSREMWFKHLQLDFANQISQVSGSALLMIPHSQPITNPAEVSLKWPDHEGLITGHGWGQFSAMERAFVRDDVLLAYCVLLEGARSKTGVGTALARLIRDPEGAITELKTQFTNNSMKTLLRTHKRLSTRKVKDSSGSRWVVT
jgi:hypothetical protein